MMRQFVRFALVGGLAAGVNWATRWAMTILIPLELAVPLAYLVGMTVAFLLNKVLVFEASGRPAREEFLRFSIVNAIAFGQVWIVTIGLYRFLFPAIGFDWRAEDIAHAVGVASPIVTSYFGHRYFSFARSPTRGALS